MRDTDKLAVRDVPGGAVVAVKVVPGASRDRVVGILGDALKIATSRPAEKGSANAAAARTLAGALGAARRDVTLIAGHAKARKAFHVAAMGAAEVRRRLQRLG